jgi:hypothetical protein
MTRSDRPARRRASNNGADPLDEALRQIGADMHDEPVPEIDADRALVRGRWGKGSMDRYTLLADAATAIQHVADGRARGKVVLAVHPTDHTTGGGSR